METLRFEARGTFRVTPEAIWPLLADTARMNRTIGLPPAEYTALPVEGGGSRSEVRMRLFGLTLARYTEHPFRWEMPHGFVVVREFHNSPLRRVCAGTELTPRNGETEILIYGEFVPRTRLGALLVRAILGPRSVNRALKQCRQFERYLLNQANDPFPRLAEKAVLPTRTEGAARELERRGLDQRAVARLLRHLREATDDEVATIRPFELADRWGFDRRETLALCLHATVVGLLVMSWNLLCPNCRVAKAEYTALSELTPKAHCESCNIAFDAAFDRSVEVRFCVAPSLRPVQSREYCIGGPMNTPHIVAQATVGPGGSGHLRCMLAAGTYALRSPRSDGRCTIQAVPSSSAATPRSRQDSGGENTLTVTVRADSIEPSICDLPDGPLGLDVVNGTDRAQLIILERAIWPETIATAAYVSTMQEFRDLFSSEVLGPDLELGIENLAFMFTDLTGSTALYQAVGQARAFRVVQDHFRLLRAAIAAKNGAVVKTIGDAIMATFPRGADALAAALQIQREIRNWDAPAGIDPHHLIKIGLHQGPCVVVTQNDRLDYFGTTVNTAARVEQTCRGGQVTASRAICQSDGAAALLAASGATLREEIVRLRGVAEPVPISRITPPGA